MSRAPTIDLGPFRIERFIGRGGMGEVWSGIHRNDQAPVAIKCITSDIALDPEFQQAFRDEVRMVASLDHPGVVLAFDHGIIDPAADAASQGRLAAGSPYLVMELASGGSLQGFQPASFSDVVPVLLDLLDILAHVHARGIVHRDLKPSNILQCTAQDLRPGLKLSDFGIAWADTPTESQSPDIGTLPFMAPEQLLGHWRDFGPWTDLFAFGCVAWKLTTGEYPFDRDRHHASRSLFARPNALRPRWPVPEGFEDWLLELLRIAPEQRTAHAADAAAGLRRLVRITEPDSQFDWRLGRPRPMAMRVAGAGLGLYSLRTIPAVGRESERDRLWNLMHQTFEAKRPHAIVIRAPSGQGKSHLARWLAHRAAELGIASYLHTAHDPTESSEQGLVRAVVERLGLEGLRPSAVGHRIRARYQRDATPEQLEGLLRDFDIALANITHLDSATRRALLYSWVQIASRSRPLIVWIDDAQWGLSSLDFVHHLMMYRDEVAAPILIVLTIREEALPTRPAEEIALQRLIEDTTAEAIETMVLEPLSAEDHGALVDALLPFEPELSARIEERTEGNPLLAIQLVGQWVDRGWLTPGPRGFRVRRDAPSRLPEQLRDVWESRLVQALQAAGPDARHALAVAAVLGREVFGGKWRQLCHRLDLPAEPNWIERLLARGLLLGDTERFSFVHAALRETLIDSTNETFLRRIHRACAEDESSDARKGLHLAAAGLAGDAVPVLLRAVDAELEGGDFHVARLRLADAEAAMLEARLSPRDPLRVTALVDRADIAEGLGDRDEAERASHEALSLARLVETPGELAQALRRVGRQFRYRGRTEDALAALREAETNASVAGDLERALLARMDRGQVLIDVGRFEEARSILAEIRDAFVATNRHERAGEAWHCLAEIARRSGDIDESEHCNREALRRFEAGGRSRWFIALIHNSLGEIARARGDWAAAETCYRASFAQFHSLQASSVVFPEINLGLVLTERDEFAEARRLFESALRRLRQQGRRPLEGAICISILPVLAALEDWDSWDDRIAMGEQLLEETGIVDPDIIASAERAAQLAEGADQRSRASRVLEIATRQRTIMES